MHTHFNMHPIIFIQHTIVTVMCRSLKDESKKKSSIYISTCILMVFIQHAIVRITCYSSRGESVKKKKKTPNMHTCPHAFTQFEIGVPQSAILRRVKSPEHLTLPRRTDIDREPSFMFVLQANNRVLCSLVKSSWIYAQILSAKC